MFLLGVAAATPDVVISGEETHECAVSGSPIAGRSGVRTRRVSLPLEYIRATGNVDVLEGWKVATATPTSLGVQAARAVLQRVGISMEQVGLVLGDTGTPYQTCPSEAQRIAGEFGVKTPAFDLVGGIAAVAHMFSVVSRWSALRAPEYLLYVSTNTPSQHVHYGRDPVAAGLFGDAAVALVLGRHPVASGTSMRVAYSAFRAEEARRAPIVIERSARVDTQALLSLKQVKDFIAAEMERLQQFDTTLSQRALFVAPQLYAAEAGEYLGQCGVRAEQCVSGVEEVGFSLGSAHGIALTKAWNAVQSGQPVVLMHCGDGQCGSVVLVAS
jgi:3-oxoacyl-[acyl-carrier-protein] synthase III